MADAKKSDRKTLAAYAALLGRDSAAALTLKRYDEQVALGRKPQIMMRNNGFTLNLGVDAIGRRI
jgi:hypothetical protein